MLTTLLTIATLAAGTTPAQELSLNARVLGFTAYIPNSTAIGYELAASETKVHDGKQVLRLTFVNKKSQNSFDILESEANGAVCSRPNAALTAGLFPVSVMEGDVVVALRKGKTDLLLVGSLMSEPSAKKMLGLAVPYRG